MRRTVLTLTLSAVAAAMVATTTPAFAAHEELSAAGLTSGGTKITTFDLFDGTAEKAVKLDGLVGDSRLVGIDYRSFDGELYGVGNGGGLYRVDPTDGSADKVGALTVALQGTSFGVDFNPAANALRVISNTGQNLRQPFAAIAAGAAQPNTIPDGALNVAGTVATGVTGAAYTNNDADGGPAPAGQPANGNTGTMLFDIDTARDQLVLQSPPNSGTLGTVGALGFDTSEVVGFDIYSELGAAGKAVSNVAIAVLTVNGERGLYAINLTSGAARAIAGTDLTRGVSDIAINPED